MTLFASRAHLKTSNAGVDTFSFSSLTNLVKNVLSSDSDETICAEICLLKASLELYKNSVIDDIYSISLLLSFHTLASMALSVSTGAQQFLVMIASNDQETDENLIG